MPHDLLWLHRRSVPAVMGILNLTPDSFSDGGRLRTDAEAIEAGRAMIAAGADILDLGAESTRPGAAAVPASRQLAWLLPVVQALAAENAVISVDTRSAEVMEACLESGASWVNDVSGLTHDPAAASVVAKAGCPVVLMHMRGTPQTMESLAHYTDVVQEVRQDLLARVAAAREAGIADHQILLDPGLGFAKHLSHSVTLLHRLPELADLGYPLVAGASRKRFVGALAGGAPVDQRLGGSLATALFAATRGAAVLRVHDVAETAQALRVWHALEDA